MEKLKQNLKLAMKYMVKKFYRFELSVERFSGTKDVLPVVVSERLIDVKQNYTGEMMEIQGQFRSFNKHEENHSKLILFVFAREIKFAEEGTYHTNNILLDGFICKPPVYRKTPSGREIADILLAVNRPHGISDYIPCICWEEMPDILAVAKLEITFFCKEEYRAENTQKKLKLRLKKNGL